MSDPAEMQAKLKVLVDTYAAQLPAKLEQLELTLNQLSQTGWDGEGFQTLYRMVHGLTGSGKTFGFSALSDAARKLENYLEPIGEAKKALNNKQLGQVKRLLDELHKMACQRDNAIVYKTQSPAIVTDSQMPHISRHIFIVEDDRALANQLQVQLSYFGYDTSVFHTLNEFRSAMQQNPKVIVLMEVSFPGDDRGGIRVMNELQQGRDMPLPVLFLSSHIEMNIRLEAVRAGSVAYLNKPIDLSALVDILDELTSSREAAAYRVFIVDDEPDLTNYYVAVLEQAGMLVNAVNDPFEVLKPLLEFAPELILIDMYMPGCNGMELARVIRQINAFVSIPIVFLSGESNLDKQLVALGLGGDDFLTKPIEAQHLISAVTNRIKRSQVLRSFMVRDSLTGLLNHTAIKAQLSHETARAKRQGKPLAFAMVDIDQFKRINDTYGHPAGDRVLKSVSRLLKQRLRENDLVGRYGGEEFAVVLADADGATAMKIMDTIRSDFEQLHQLAEDRAFSVTFSCGVADLANFDDASRLIDAADKALYKAKRAGRNQIVVADNKSPDSSI
jgi:diguanylate cyclase (GGDEF)-like protein